MTHLTQEELKVYGSRMMAASALINADRHLSACAACRYELRRLINAPTLPSVVAEMEEPVHLTYEEMTTYIDARLDAAERARMDEHTAICRSCAKELRELQAFDARMAAKLNAVSVNQVEVEEAPSWLTRAAEGVREFFATPRRLRFAGAGVGMIALGAVSLLQVQVQDTATRHGSLAMTHLSLLSAASHPQLFYGGFLIAGSGAVALLYGLFKK